MYISMSALKSTENCVCILHNLSYQIEAELPHKYTVDLRQSQQNLSPKEKSVGCFAYRGAKITEVIPSDNNPFLQYTRCFSAVWYLRTISCEDCCAAAGLITHKNIHLEADYIYLCLLLWTGRETSKQTKLCTFLLCRLDLCYQQNDPLL